MRKTAFRSAGLLAKREFVPALLARLATPKDRKFARDALITMGDRIAGTLGDHLVDPGAPVAVRKEITRVLDGIGTPVQSGSFMSVNVSQSLSMLSSQISGSHI